MQPLKIDIFILSKRIKKYLNDNHIFFNNNLYEWEQRLDENISTLDETSLLKTIAQFLDNEELEFNLDELNDIFEFIIILSSPSLNLIGEI